jgi:hypothetical protein
VISRPDLSWENYEWMRARVPVFPVFHLGESWQLFDDYVATNPPVMGMGGVAGDKKRGALTQSLLHVAFSRLASPGEPTRIPIHGFAMGPGHITRAYPWGSADSATATRAAGGGRLLFFNGTEILTLTVRNDVLMQMDRVLSPPEVARVAERLAEYGYTVADIAEFSVLLVAVNVLEMRRLLEHIPRVYTPAVHHDTLLEL